jgi:hypothetical protein
MKVGDRVWFTNQTNGADDIGTLIATGSNPQGDLVWFLQDEMHHTHAAHSHELVLLTDLSGKYDVDPAEEIIKASEAPKQTHQKKEKQND